MNKHTIGPWTMRPDGFVYAVNGERVCSPHSTLPDSAKWSKQRKDLKANARLIAAAPDLLEACRALLDLELSSLRGSDDKDYCHEVQLAIAAIAKARGEI